MARYFQAHLNSVEGCCRSGTITLRSCARLEVSFGCGIVSVVLTIQCTGECLCASRPCSIARCQSASASSMSKRFAFCAGEHDELITFGWAHKWLLQSVVSTNFWWYISPICKRKQDVRSKTLSGVRHSFNSHGCFGNSISGHTTRAPPQTQPVVRVGLELATDGIQFYVIAN